MMIYRYLGYDKAGKRAVVIKANENEINGFVDCVKCDLLAQESLQQVLNDTFEVAGTLNDYRTLAFLYYFRKNYSKTKSEESFDEISQLSDEHSYYDSTRKLGLKEVRNESISL